VTKIIPLAIVNLITPKAGTKQEQSRSKAGAKHEQSMSKARALVQQTNLWLPMLPITRSSLYNITRETVSKLKVNMKTKERIIVLK
jgi:hypothetical protein